MRPIDPSHRPSVGLVRSFGLTCVKPRVGQLAAWHFMTVQPSRGRFTVPVQQAGLGTTTMLDSDLAFTVLAIVSSVFSMGMLTFAIFTF